MEKTKLVMVYVKNVGLKAVKPEVAEEIRNKLQKRKLQERNRRRNERRKNNAKQGEKPV